MVETSNSLISFMGRKALVVEKGEAHGDGRALLLMYFKYRSF